VAFLDALVGQLLTSAGHGSPASPLVVATADHGEALGEHGEQTHGLFAYETTLRVPLIVSWPGAIGPRVVTPAVSLVDVAPTIAALAGLPAVPGQDGRSLVPLVDGGAGTAGATPAYAETLFPHLALGWAPLRSLRDGTWKLIDAPEPELYDLASDPGEQTNLHAARPDIANRLRRQLDAMAPPVAAGAGVPDPKRMTAMFDRLLHATRAVSRGDADAAERLAREVLAADAANPLAHYVLGRALLGSGRFDESMAAFRRVLATGRQGADAHHWMALARLRLGDRAGALAEEEAALALDARHDAALALRAGLLLSSGRRAEAVQSLRDAVTADPLDLSLRVSLADLLADAGLAAEAEPEYRRVLETRPNDVGALVGLGLLLARAERLEPAVAALTRALEIDPGQDEARFERAVLFQRLGRVAEARAGYERLDSATTRPDIRQAAARRLSTLPR
jgi:tetratricopeptide (TPR) repeat protein